MSSYTSEPAAPEGIGGLMFRAMLGPAVIAAGTWAGYAVYPQAALAMAAVGVLAMGIIVALKARRLQKTRPERQGHWAGRSDPAELDRLSGHP
jgi:membrane protein implicated in regulation of membrane protease activity